MLVSPQKLLLTWKFYKVIWIQEEGEKHLLNSSLVPITLYPVCNVSLQQPHEVSITSIILSMRNQAYTG